MLQVNVAMKGQTNVNLDQNAPSGQTDLVLNYLLRLICRNGQSDQDSYCLLSGVPLNLLRCIKKPSFSRINKKYPKNDI